MHIKRGDGSVGPKDIGVKIRNYRITRGLTQQEFADMLFIVPQTVSKWERGASYPDVFKLREICRVLNVSISDMLDEMSLHSSEDYLLAIDGGGAFTNFVLFKNDGTVIAKTMMETKSPLFSGIEETLENLKSGIDQLSTYEKTPKRIYAALPGSRLQNRKLHAALSKMYPVSVVDVESDIYCLSGMLPPSPVCIAANVGVGSIVCGFKGSSFDRVGGWGYLFDDPGSEYDIGKRVLTVAHQYADGLAEISETARLVEIKLGASVKKFTDEIHISGRNYVASFAPIAFEAYSVGDETAKKIISESAEGIARMIDHMYLSGQYGNHALILCNFRKYGDVMCKFIKEKLDPGIDAEFCTLPSVLGAMKICMRYEYGESDFKEFTRNFNNSYFRNAP